MATKPTLKVVTPPSSDRTALASAIAAAAAAAKCLAEAETASDNALEKLGAAFREQEELERLHRDLSRNAAAAPFNDHGRLIAALAGGSDVEVPAPPVDRLSEVSAALAAAEKEIRKWREIRKITGQEVDARRVMLESARRDVAKAANVAAASTVDVDALAARFSADLATLRQVNELAPDDARVRDALGGIMDAPAALRHPAAQRLRDFREALLQDANAPSPE